MKTAGTKGILFLILANSFLACQPKGSKPVEGRIKRSTISVTGKIPGRIEEIKVHEGQDVRMGDTLAILSLPEVEAKMAQAKGAVQAAQAQYNMAQKGATDLQLQQLTAKLDASKEQYQFAQTSVKRLSNMLRDSLISRQQYDEAYTKMQGAKAQYTAALAQYNEARNGARTEQQQMALGQKNQAAGALQEASVANKERYVIAPQNMSIETITLSAGELALPGYTLFTGYLSATTYFRFTFPESQIAKIQRGQTVRVRIPYKNIALQGKVVSIAQLSHYADVTTAYPNYEMDEAIYEIKVEPGDRTAAAGLMANAKAILEL